MATINALEGLQERKIQAISKLKIRQAENNSIRQNQELEDYQERGRLRTERAQKAAHQNTLRTYLDYQKQQHQEAKDVEKATDKQLAQVMQIKEEQDEAQRNEYFDRLQKFQEDSEMREEIMR